MANPDDLIKSFVPDDADRIKCFLIERDGEIWRNVDTGELYDRPPIGAMWLASWYTRLHSQLEHPLVVCTPGGDWLIDSRANNCTMPDDDEHFCWILHGRPPNITVDKNGNTCGAGGGSILKANGYHAFLRDGHLVKT